MGELLRPYLLNEIKVSPHKGVLTSAISFSFPVFVSLRKKRHLATTNSNEMPRS